MVKDIPYYGLPYEVLTPSQRLRRDAKVSEVNAAYAVHKKEKSLNEG